VKLDGSDESRLERIKRAGDEVMWPELPAAYLFDLLFEVGPFMNTGMGTLPLTWLEINAWKDAIGFDLQPWEARILKSSSAEYVAQMNLASKPNCPPPGKVVDKDPEQVAKHIKNTLRG
jgi:hypothetical protein